MTDLPGITIVLATDRDLDDPELMAAIYSAEHQDYPSELIDINLVQAIDGVTLEDAQRYGVGNATTDWVAVMSDHDDWPQDRMLQCGLIARRYPFAADVQVRDFMMYKKDHWLRIHKEKA